MNKPPTLTLKQREFLETAAVKFQLVGDDYWPLCIKRYMLDYRYPDYPCMDTPERDVARIKQALRDYKL